jgi:hypothetical protein
MLIDTVTIGFVIGPEAIINVPVYMNESTLSMSSVLSPFTDVFSTIWPGLFTLTISKTAFPFSYIHCSSFKLIRRPFLSLLIRIVLFLRNCFFTFFISEIFAASDMLAP